MVFGLWTLDFGLTQALVLLAWSIVGLWLVAVLWTRFCLNRQTPLAEISETQADEPFISVILPARNEAHRILRENIASILAQNYQNFELIVVNDRSTDNTKEILNEIKIRNPQSAIRILTGKEPDETWLGKPHALQQGLEKAKGDWILTTDADIIFAPNALRSAIFQARKCEADALTLIPKGEFKSFWEYLFFPIFAWFCLLGMPVYRVNNPKRKETMGVGNFFMLKRDVLEKLGGFECVKNDVAEDLKLAEILKAKGFRLRLDFAPDLIRTRMYANFGEIWEGFTKNLFSGMKFSIAKTIFGVFSILVFGVLPVIGAFIALFFGYYALAVPLFFAYILQIAVLILIHREYQGNVVYAILTPLGLLLFAAILVNSAYRVLSGKGVTWKGRPIYEKGGIAPPKKS